MDKDSELMLTFLASIAQEESIKKREAMIWSLAQRFIGGRQMAAVPFSSEIEEISMDGFQVVSGEYFARRAVYFSPACTIWSGGITFNKVALVALNNCERVRIEIHPQKKSVLLVPVTVKDKDGIPWRKNIKEYAPRRIECVKFVSKLYEMWGWDTGFVYRAVGRIVTVDNKVMLLFDFSSPEQWKSKEKKAEK